VRYALPHDVIERFHAQPNLLENMGEGRRFYRPVCGNDELESLVREMLLKASMAFPLPDDPTVPWRAATTGG
jgi:hypothetical protein